VREIIAVMPLQGSASRVRIPSELLIAGPQRVRSVAQRERSERTVLTPMRALRSTIP